ncbi:hypothetical protein CLAIMM_13452 [Cladophialophora immunda]|nr:hypothetical protein CLAIMM_13452 [Cladophialophora immunda]
MAKSMSEFRIMPPNLRPPVNKFWTLAEITLQPVESLATWQTNRRKLRTTTGSVRMRTTLCMQSTTKPARDMASTQKRDMCTRATVMRATVMRATPNTAKVATASMATRDTPSTNIIKMPIEDLATNKYSGLTHVI